MSPATTAGSRGLVLRPAGGLGLNAPSRVSSLRSASRVASSGPWQAKQLSDRIGLMSRWKSTVVAGSAAATARAGGGAETARSTLARAISWQANGPSGETTRGAATPSDANGFMAKVEISRWLLRRSCRRQVRMDGAGGAAP